MNEDRQLVERLRSETPGSKHVAHLNNAGCALPPQAVVAAQSQYLEAESLRGGYETAANFEKSGVNFYDKVAEIMGARPAEIGFCQSATEGWRRVLYALPLPAGATVAFDESTYGSNVLALLDAKERFGWSLKPIGMDSAGVIDLEELERVLQRKEVDLVAITHMPAQSGVVNPLDEVSRLARQGGALTLVDACQTLGQVPINVEDNGIDSLVFTGRKYLRAPRGTGGYFLRERLFERMTPLGPDIRAAEVLNETLSWRLRRDGLCLEQWERNWVSFAGCAAAVEYLTKLDKVWIWDRIRTLAQRLVHELGDVSGVKVRRRAEEQGGIVVFDLPTQDLIDVRNWLREERINVMYAGPQNAPIEMFKNRERGWIRASVHYYNIEADIESLCAAVTRYLARRS